MEELNCDTAFTIPLFGGIKISESVAVTWIIMAVVVLLCVIFVRNLSVENPGKAQLIGLFGFKPPTKDLNVTIALAVMSMCLIDYSGIHKNGLKHWVKHFAKPVPFVAPIMVLEIVIRPLSLCMRLFGNVLGAFVIMELLKIVAPAIIPIPFSFYFDIFDGFLQAYVFVFLTALFMNEEQE